MLDRVGGFMREVGLIVRSHHERWDGGGYPDGLAGEQIPLEARIISCCDTWNAMRTDRPYRKALDYDTRARRSCARPRGRNSIRASSRPCSRSWPARPRAGAAAGAEPRTGAEPVSPDAAGAPTAAA